MKKSFIVKRNLLLLTVLLLFAGCKGKKDSTGTAAHEHKEAQQDTCPMHPQIVQDNPGKCPICGMDLVPKSTSGGSAVDTGLAHLLKPVNEQVVARTTTVLPESGVRIFSMDVQGRISYDTRRQTSIASRVSGRIEKLYIKYNYQPVRAGQLIMEIYSPDLAAAQRELIFLSRGSGDRTSLLPKARQRLLLLGMQPAQIDQVLRTGKVLYRVPVYSKVSGYILEKATASVQPPPLQTTAAPASGGGDGMSGMGGGAGSGGGMAAGGSTAQSPAENSPILAREGQYVGAGQTIFTVYNNSTLVAEFAFNPSLASQLKRGQKLVFRRSADPETVYTGSIGLIQPTFRSGQNFTLARVYVSDGRFQVGQLVSANIPVVARGWWVPASAVLQLGTRSVVFKKEGNVFVPKTITAGMRHEGLVQITEGVSGWEIAKNAAYLVDSESFIRVSSNNQTE